MHANTVQKRARRVAEQIMTFLRDTPHCSHGAILQCDAGSLMPCSAPCPSLYLRSCNVHTECLNLDG